MTIHNMNSIGVIGAGTMGQGIAQVCAQAGFKVLLYDIDAGVVSRGLDAIRLQLDSLKEKGKITDDRKKEILGLISPVSDFRLLQVDAAIEAVIEKTEVKQKIFSELEKLNGRDCLLLTNTSSIPVTKIASVLKYPERFAGLHFFNPAPVMKLVEVIRGGGTSDETVALTLSLAEKLGKKAVLAQDAPGFIVNRVARHFYVESLLLMEEQVADFKSIDTLMRASGFRMGPFELMDLIGVDVNFSVTSSMFQAFHQNAKFRPSRIQQQKVDAGHLGRKTGKGFYDYK